MCTPFRVKVLMIELIPSSRLEFNIHFLGEMAWLYLSLSPTGGSISTHLPRGELIIITRRECRENPEVPGTTQHMVFFSLCTLRINQLTCKSHVEANSPRVQEGYIAEKHISVWVVFTLTQVSCRG